MAEENRIDTWSKKWTEGKTGWHSSDINPILAKHYKTFLKSAPQRILVPLCGKSLDLKWLHHQGHNVVGIEAVELPVKAFFKENDLVPTIEKLSWATLYKTKDEGITIYVCDLFNVDPVAIGKFDAVWDRGSLVAINVSDREGYAKFIKGVLKDNFSYLLASFQYTPNEEFSGPPRNTPQTEVERLFGDKCNLEILEVIEMFEDEKANNVWHLEDCRELAILLKPKN